MYRIYFKFYLALEDITKGSQNDFFESQVVGCISEGTVSCHSQQTPKMR